MIQSLTNFWRWWIVDATPVILAWLTIPLVLLLVAIVAFLVWVTHVDWR